MKSNKMAPSTAWRAVFIVLSLTLTFVAVALPVHAQENKSNKWQPVKGPLMTRWARDVNPQKVHPEYPRPQMVRSSWMNLNGLWQYTIQPKEKDQPKQFNATILVPFPVESSLSGVGKTVGQENRLWYRRFFKLPKHWSKKQIILNFGAVDWETTVWVNGQEVGTHRGGYDAFSFDITDVLKEMKKQEIVISVWDPTDAGTQPRGKQVAKPHSIWYTSNTGIWQTVWLEPVNPAHIVSFKTETDIDRQIATIRPVCTNTDDGSQIKAIVRDGRHQVSTSSAPAGEAIPIPIESPKLWTPDDPFLYNLELILTDKTGKETDQVSSYFGMRKIALGKDTQGFTRLMLNNKFVFQFGPLDQGWWPDGLYTAPTDDALHFDIETTKKLGFNLARKHVKVEAARWYYWCDKLGLLVWQDMPSGDAFISGDDPDIQRTPESGKEYEKELHAMINGLYNHPSVIVWVPYNEGWGQWDTPRITKLIKSWDPTRLVNSASGWTDRGVGDIHDEHTYPAPQMPEPDQNRAIVIGEFGGLGLPIERHTWQAKDNWGYRSFKNTADLTKAYTNLVARLYPMVDRGLSAAVYTQTSDVEIEVNGLMTYDRAIIKMDTSEVTMVNRGFLPPDFNSTGDIFLESITAQLSSRKGGEMYYTIDGSNPDKRATPYTGPIVLKQSATIKACTYFTNGKVSGVSEHSYRKVSLRQPKTIKDLKPGIRWHYYENDGEVWTKLPDFSKLQAKSSGTTDKINLKVADRKENFGLLYEGYFKATRDGIYTFYTTSDDGSALYIGPDKIVDNDLQHGKEQKQGQIALKAGYHPIKITFFQGPGDESLVVEYNAPGSNEEKEFSGELFYRK